MLSLSSRRQRTEPIIEFDPYIPLSITWLGSSSGAPLYWRVGDHGRSLAEVGFDAATGALCSFTLTLVQAFEEVETLPPIALPHVSSGLLVADPSQWKGTCYLDERISFRVSLSPSGIRFALLPDRAPHALFVSGPVQLVLNAEHGLAELRVVGLDKEQQKVLRVALADLMVGSSMGSD